LLRRPRPAPRPLRRSPHEGPRPARPADGDPARVARGQRPPAGRAVPLSLSSREGGSADPPAAARLCSRALPRLPRPELPPPGPARLPPGLRRLPRVPLPARAGARVPAHPGPEALPGAKRGRDGGDGPSPADGREARPLPTLPGEPPRRPDDRLARGVRVVPLRGALHGA